MKSERSPWVRAGALVVGLLVVPALGLIAFCPGGSARVGPTSSTAKTGGTEPGSTSRPRPGTTGARPRENRPTTATTGSAQDDWAVEGEVETPDGKAASEAKITCAEKGNTTTADELGRFHMSAEALGCHATATKSGFAASSEVVLVAKGNRIKLLPPTGVAGNIVEASGAPIVTFWVGLEPVGGLDGGKPPSVFGDSVEGAFEITDVPPGRYVVIGSAQGHALQRFDPVDVVAGQIRGGLRLTLKKGGKVSGRVLDAVTGGPLVGAFVYVDGTVNNSIMGPSSLVGTSGEYTVDGTPLEPFALRARLFGYVDVLVPDLHVAPGEERKLEEIRLKRMP